MDETQGRASRAERAARLHREAGTAVDTASDSEKLVVVAVGQLGQLMGVRFSADALSRATPEQLAGAVMEAYKKADSGLEAMLKAEFESLYGVAWTVKDLLKSSRERRSKLFTEISEASARGDDNHQRRLTFTASGRNGNAQPA
ncbi:MAG: YbaB/EbfC family nucleoid-associated protein [Stackebrandtia sp.]